MAVTVVLVTLVVTLVELKHVQTVNLISHLTDLNAVILHGMSLVLIVLHWKVITTGIALDVNVLVML